MKKGSRRCSPAGRAKWCWIGERNSASELSGFPVIGLGRHPSPLPLFLEVLILEDFKSFAPEVLILGDFKSLFPEVLILVGFKAFFMSEIQKNAKILEVLILEDLAFSWI
jgi:hypothetical protein